MVRKDTSRFFSCSRRSGCDERLNRDVRGCVAKLSVVAAVWSFLAAALTVEWTEKASVMPEWVNDACPLHRARTGT